MEEEEFDGKLNMAENVHTVGKIVRGGWSCQHCLLPSLLPPSSKVSQILIQIPRPFLTHHLTTPSHKLFNKFIVLLIHKLTLSTNI